MKVDRNLDDDDSVTPLICYRPTSTTSHELSGNLFGRPDGLPLVLLSRRRTLDNLIDNELGISYGRNNVVLTAFDPSLRSRFVQSPKDQ
ncbi:hypothetical protein BgiBS90_002238 [Biomphalaria glabrata]|nr:hypothetical protein BgiBS90_002238 [Biomphalaria glabrata]